MPLAGKPISAYRRTPPPLPPRWQSPGIERPPLYQFVVLSMRCTRSPSRSSSRHGAAVRAAAWGAINVGCKPRHAGGAAPLSSTQPDVGAFHHQGHVGSAREAAQTNPASIAPRHRWTCRATSRSPTRRRPCAAARRILRPIATTIMPPLVAAPPRGSATVRPSFRAPRRARRPRRRASRTPPHPPGNHSRRTIRSSRAGARPRCRCHLPSRAPRTPPPVERAKVKSPSFQHFRGAAHARPRRSAAVPFPARECDAGPSDTAPKPSRDPLQEIPVHRATDPY